MALWEVTINGKTKIEYSDGAYSQYGYDIPGATRSSVIYPSFDPCIFEIKFPTLDIKGRITTL